MHRLTPYPINSEPMHRGAGNNVMASAPATNRLPPLVAAGVINGGCSMDTDLTAQHSEPANRGRIFCLVNQGDRGGQYLENQ